MTSLYIQVCRTCGSTNVLRDAWAKWCNKTQEWELSSVFDEGYCEDCDGPCKIEPIATIEVKQL